MRFIYTLAREIALIMTHGSLLFHLRPPDDIPMTCVITAHEASVSGLRRKKSLNHGRLPMMFDHAFVEYPDHPTLRYHICF